MIREEICKPKALAPGSAVRIVASAGPVEEAKLRRGTAELERLGFRVECNEAVLARDGYFAGAAEQRTKEVGRALLEPGTDGLIAARGGYGTAYLLEALDGIAPPRPKAILGYSDLTLLHAFAWHRWNWVTFYGPMVAAGFEAGPGRTNGYDERSFRLAISETESGWSLPLAGESMVEGEAEGRIIGGCLTLLRSLIGTIWEPETEGTILLIEDLNMKPYQVDRALMHLKLAGKLDGVRGFLLGDFPGCEPPADDGPTVHDVVQRLLEPMGVPIVWGAPVGHTRRPVLTVPFGVRARLEARGAGKLEILEPAVAAQ
jgi:muramoyltetrapeptide carboxypeptidase